MPGPGDRSGVPPVSVRHRASQINQQQDMNRREPPVGGVLMGPQPAAAPNRVGAPSASPAAPAPQSRSAAPARSPGRPQGEARLPPPATRFTPPENILPSYQQSRNNPAAPPEEERPAPSYEEAMGVGPSP